MPYSIGSALEKPVFELVEEATKDPIIKIMSGPDGLKKLAEMLGLEKEFDPSKLSSNPCKYCPEIMSRLKQEPTSKGVKK